MEGRAGDGAARDEDGLKLRNGGEGSGAADLNRDIEEFGFGALWLVFVSNRPAGCLGGGPEFTAHGEAVEFYDRSVGLVGEIMPQFSHFLHSGVHRIFVRAFEDLL